MRLLAEESERRHSEKVGGGTCARDIAMYGPREPMLSPVHPSSRERSEPNRELPDGALLPSGAAFKVAPNLTGGMREHKAGTERRARSLGGRRRTNACSCRRQPLSWASPTQEVSPVLPLPPIGPPSLARERRAAAGLARPTPEWWPQRTVPARCSAYPTPRAHPPRRSTAVAGTTRPIHGIHSAPRTSFRTRSPSWGRSPCGAR